MPIAMPTNTLSCTFFYDTLIRDYDFYLLEVSKSYLAEVEKNKENYNRHIIKNVTSSFIETFAPLGVTKIDTFTYLCHFKKETTSPRSLNEELYSLIRLGSQELTKLKEITLFEMILTIFHEKGLLMYNSDNHKFNQFFYMSDYKKGEKRRIAMEVEVREVDNQGKKRKLHLWFTTRQFKQVERREIKVYSHNGTLYCPIKNRKSPGYTHYDVFVEETHGKLRRADKIDLEEGATFWIKRAWKYNAKEILPFVDVGTGTPEAFSLTKIGYYQKFKRDIERVAEEYISLSYESQEVESYRLSSWTKEGKAFKENLKRGLEERGELHIYVPPHIEQSRGGKWQEEEVSKRLEEGANTLLKAIEKISSTYTKVKVVKELKKGVLTLVILFEKAWYEEDGVKGHYKDPYPKLKKKAGEIPMQTLTIETIGKDTPLLSSLKELFIKDELVTGHPSPLVKHTVPDDYTFYLPSIESDEKKDKATYRFFGIKITNGYFTLPFEVSQESNAYTMLQKALLKSDKNSLEFIYSTDNDRHFYGVSRTTLYPIGDNEKFLDEIATSSMPYFIGQDEIVDIVKRIQEAQEKKLKPQEKTGTLFDISMEDEQNHTYAFELFYEKIKVLYQDYKEEKLSHKILFAFLDSLDKEEQFKNSRYKKLPRQTIKNSLESAAGRKLRFNIKGREKMETLLPALTDINYFYEDETLYYNIGYGLSSIKYKIEKNNPFRKIVPITEESFFMESTPQEIDIQAYFTMLDVFFVKYAEATVKPYPIKYLEEGLAIRG